MSISFEPTIRLHAYNIFTVFADLLKPTLYYIHFFPLFASHTQRLNIYFHSHHFFLFLLFLLHITFHFGTSCKLACNTRRTHKYTWIYCWSQMNREENGLNDAREDQWKKKLFKCQHTQQSVLGKWVNWMKLSAVHTRTHPLSCRVYSCRITYTKCVSTVCVCSNARVCV